MHIGRHISIGGSLLNSLVVAEKLGADAMQIFTRNPRSWHSGTIEESVAQAFSAGLKASGVRVVASHMPYLPNVASPNAETWKKSVASLRDELVSCNELGIHYVVMHLGSHLGAGPGAGKKNIIDAITEVEGSIGGTNLLLENEAGHKNSMGCDVRELAEIYDGVGSRKVGFCLDTCHLFAYGYDIREHEVLDRIHSELGFDKVHALHLNDAKEELGSHKDRHDNIGFGHIGTEGFRSFLNYNHLAGKTMILETPPSDRITAREEIVKVRSLIKKA